MPEPIIIALDAMGGDNGPRAVIPGAALIAAEYPHVRFMIFGDESILSPLAAKQPALQGRFEIVHTDKFIANDEKPSAALRGGKGSSMRLAIEAVENGKAAAIVSSGNTGALMALAKSVLKSLPGIHRPAIASIFPTSTGSTIMLDLGANVLVDAETLAQFAVMGAVFAKAHKNIARPRIGLLNVGTEDTKGPDHVRGAAAILSAVELPGEYIGFVEGNDITMGDVDVVVSDGYAGNIALKTAEGVGKLTGHFFKETIKSDPLAILGGLLAYFSIKKLKARMDPRLYNGGVFLGLNGMCIKSHGGSDDFAFSRAILLALQLSERGYIKAVSKDIENLMGQDKLLTEAAV